MAHFMPELHKTLTLTSTHHTCHEKSLQRMWICKTSPQACSVELWTGMEQREITCCNTDGYSLVGMGT